LLLYNIELFDARAWQCWACGVKASIGIIGASICAHRHQTAAAHIIAAKQAKYESW